LNVVGSNGLLFHSTHATSHALQPMHVVTSMYLQTSSSRDTPRPGIEPEWPEMALIWRVPVGMFICHEGTKARRILCTKTLRVFVSSWPKQLRFFYLDHEPLELRRVRIRVDHGWRQQVHRRQRRAPLV